VTSATSPTRDFAVSVFVVWRSAVLLHRHRKLGLWLPPGGHVEPHELPDDAAVREVLEETGVVIELLGPPPFEAPGPRQLVRPRGVQLESISPGHEHIDLVYLGRPLEPYDGLVSGDEDGLAWYDAVATASLGLTREMTAWVALALREVGAVPGG
jgi:8-oxo-dGTP pyrophosphatase MutT (NUDIX family)